MAEPTKERVENALEAWLGDGQWEPDNEKVMARALTASGYPEELETAESLNTRYREALERIKEHLGPIGIGNTSKPFPAKDQQAVEESYALAHEALKEPA